MLQYDKMVCEQYSTIFALSVVHTITKLDSSLQTSTLRAVNFFFPSLTVIIVPLTSF